MLKRAFVFLLSGFLGFFLLGSPLMAQREDLRKSLREKLKGLERVKPPKSPEDLLPEIIKAYKINDYDRVAQLEGRLPKRVELRDEEMMILAESLLYAGYPERALEWAKGVASVKRGTKEWCQANFIALQSLYLLGKDREAKKLKDEFSDSFCAEEMVAPLSLVEYFYEKKDLRGDSVQLTKHLPQILYPRINFHLKQGDFKRAEEETFRYLALTGDHRRGAELMFKLAEGNFRMGKRLRAKAIYQLIISEWDLTKEAFLSKFRLYQMAYDQAKVKELLPAKFYDDLFGYIAQIKRKYPTSPLAEEVSIFEFETYYTLKNWFKSRVSLKEFLARYKDSQHAERAKSLFCPVSHELSKELVRKEKISEAINILTEDQKLLKETRCGAPFLVLGDYFFANLAYLTSLDYYLPAFMIGVAKENTKDLLVKLSFLSYLKGEREFFGELFPYLEKNFQRELSEDPYYQYLKGSQTIKVNPRATLSIFERVRFSNLPPFLKANLLNLIFQQAIEKEDLALASEVFYHPLFNRKEEDYVLLLSLSIYRDLKLFEQLLPEAKKRYPKSPKILFLSALYYERKGNLKEGTKTWRELAQQDSELKIFGEAKKRFEELLDRSRGLIY